MLLSPTLLLLFDILLYANCLLPERKGYPAPSQNQNQPSSSPARRDEHFDQKLDHFTETDTRTWKQLYYSESSFHTKGGPAYLWIGQEIPISSEDLDYFYWTGHGRKTGAIIFQLEHRFYGSSQPLGDLSIESLHYLTVAQVLADMAAFISAMNKKYDLPQDTKWIVFGASYAGNLAAWMRVKYPDIIHGAVASSAPVAVKLEIPEYFDAVINTFAAFKKECTDELAKANKELEEKLQTPEGRKEIEKVFKFCNPLTGEKFDNAFIHYNIALYFSGAVQSSESEIDIKDICNNMFKDADKLSLMERYWYSVNIFLENYGSTCLPSLFNDFTEMYKNTATFDFQSNLYLVERQWQYQGCAELGLLQTVGPNNAVFSKLVSLEIFEAWCMDAYGKSFNKAFTSKGVDSINESFGGASINTPRIVFVNGLLDPWHALSITSKDKNPNVDVILIKGIGHGLDLITGSESDPKELKEAQTQLASLVDGWLNQPK